MIASAQAFPRGPEVPPAALARLREVGLAQVPPVTYGMRYIFSVAGSYWAITQAWGDDDPRRASIQRGEIDPANAHDIVATLPGDCSPSEAGSFIERYFRRSSDPKADAIKQVEATVRAEQAQQEKNLQAMILASNEEAMRMTAHDRRLLAGADAAHPMVPGADFSATAAGELPVAPPPKKRGRSSDAE